MVHADAVQGQRSLMRMAAGKLEDANPNVSPRLCAQVRRTRKQLYEHIDGDYYGYRDEEDGILVKVEAAAEAVMRTEVGFIFA